MDSNALYYQLPYVKEFTAEVVSCAPGKKGFSVVLSETGFYPEGGGQPADTGEVFAVSSGTDGISAMEPCARILDVHERDGSIIHTADRELAAGVRYRFRLDWERRFRHMQNHSGEHIVSGLIHRKYGYDNVGFHMGPVVTIDFNGELSWDELMEIETEANRIVYENRPVRALYPTGAELREMDFRSKKELSGTVRLLEIPGADLCACCGTHVERTGEIGLIKFLSLMKHRGGVRIEMLSGEAALRDYQAKTDSNTAISQLLSAKPTETAEAVRRMKEELSEKDARIAALSARYASLRVMSLPDEGQTLLLFEEDMQPIALRKLCDLAVKSGKADIVCALSRKAGSGAGGDDRPEYMYVIGSSNTDLRPLVKQWNSALSGRGGGSREMVQGSFRAEEAEIRTALS